MARSGLRVRPAKAQRSLYNRTSTPPLDAVLPKVHTRAKVPELTGKRVLIVDDNATNLFILRSHCENWGMLVRTTQSPREAIRWVRNGDPFDVGILDMMIPEMDGHQLGLELRTLRTSDSLPLVLLSSAGVSIAEIGSGNLFTAAVAKPVKHDLLFDILMEAMGGAKRSTSRIQPKPIERLGEYVPLSILAAEDNLVNQKLLLRVLKEIGYQADIVPNGIEVMSAVKRKRYDIIFMDVHMPEMDGLETTRVIMSSVPREERPVIVAVTADALQGDRESVCKPAWMITSQNLSASLTFREFLSDGVRKSRRRPSNSRRPGDAHQRGPRKSNGRSHPTTRARD